MMKPQMLVVSFTYANKMRLKELYSNTFGGNMAKKQTLRKF